jgi:hypothetical protein
MEEQKNLTVLRDVLYEVTGRRLAVVTTIGSKGPAEGNGSEETVDEESWISLLKDTFDATEVEDMP